MNGCPSAVNSRAPLFTGIRNGAPVVLAAMGIELVLVAVTTVTVMAVLLGLNRYTSAVYVADREHTGVK